MNKQKSIAIATIVFASFLSGCSMKVREIHHLGIWDHNTQQFTDFYRIKVHASAHFSTAHYTAGIYDEKAVDLMFNELRTSDPGKLNTRSLRSLSSAEDSCLGLEESGVEARTEGICISDGIFVFILSTDARAISDTIATFSQIEALAAAIYSLANKELIADSNRIKAYNETRNAEGASLVARIQLFFDQADMSLQGSEAEEDRIAEFREIYRQLLSTIARPLGRKAPFYSFLEATLFFSNYQRSVEADS